MESHVTGTSEKPGRSRLTLWLILAVCVAPVIGSYAAYYVWQPASHVNYGELIGPRTLPDAELAAASGTGVFRLGELRGQWVLLMAAALPCDASCRRNLVYMRQVQLAQGRDSGRIERVWLVTGEGVADAALVAEHPGLRVARDSRGIVAAAAPGGAIHVVDPLGNLMMRFPADPDPRRMLKDVSRLLRHSKWK